MQLVDVLAVVLVGGAGASFACGEAALARADDLHALYWLVVGILTLRSATQIARPAARS